MVNTTQTFYSNGKLLITGEYLVLDGAKAFALPTQKGQNLIITPNQTDIINWKSYDFDGSLWFEDSFTVQEILVNQKLETTTIKSTLINILHEALQLNPSFLNTEDGFNVETHLTFPRNWGLGTSSTLINNIAQWAKIDAFELLKNSFGGSGYDIACAQNNTPIIYQIVDQKPTVEPIKFSPEFKNKLYFVYLNKKQNSKTAIQSYHQNAKNRLSETIVTIDKITQKTIKAETVEEFAKLVEQHESILSNILELETIREKLFHDFKGVTKSLGAWGGDFVLAVAKENPTEYFKSKGFETVIPYQEIIL